jgi:hypothetical protein
MSSKEISTKVTLERPTMPSSTSFIAITTPSLTPSTAPTTPVAEKEEAVAAAPPVLAAKPPTVLTTVPGANRNPLSSLERDYDPSADNLSIEELLARPRLPRSPYESFHKSALNGRTMKPLKAAAAAVAGASRDDARDFEMAKDRLRAASVEMGRMTFSKE